MTAHRLGAERHPNPQLARALRHGGRGDAEEATTGREQQPEQAEHAAQRRHQAFAR